jgi:hypothetical protein
VPAVADEKVRPQFTFEIADLLRERRSDKAKGLCGRPTRDVTAGQSGEVTGQPSKPAAGVYSEVGGCPCRIDEGVARP